MEPGAGRRTESKRGRKAENNHATERAYPEGKPRIAERKVVQLESNGAKRAGNAGVAGQEKR